MDGIEPVTSPAFSIPGGGEEIVYEVLNGSGVFIFGEGNNFFGSGEVAVEIDEESACKSG